MTTHPTASQSVDNITNSTAFQQAAQSYWSHAPLPKDRAASLRGLRVFTDGEIADSSVAGHQRIKDELQRIFDHVERWRLAKHWAYNHPERQSVLGMLNLEKILLDAAEVAEENWP